MYPTSVQTPATIDATEIQQLFYIWHDLYKDHADSCCRKWHCDSASRWVFHKFLTPAPGPKEKRGILPKSTLALQVPRHLAWKQWWRDSSHVENDGVSSRVTFFTESLDSTSVTNNDSRLESKPFLHNLWASYGQTQCGGLEMAPHAMEWSRVDTRWCP